MRVALTYKLIKHECIDFLKQPPLWVLVILPIVMSKMLLSIFPIMIAGGYLFVQVGIVIGLTMNSSKTASALSSVVMITLFLIGTLYTALPEWKILLQFIPSVVVVENIQAIFNEQLLLFEIGLLVFWMLLFYFIINYLVKKSLIK